MTTIQIKINGSIPGHAPGKIVTVQCDEEGTPLDFHWRRRMRDSETDGCCEVVKPQAKSKKPLMSKRDMAGEEK